MKRIFGISTLAGAITAAVLLPSPTSRSEAQAGPLGRVLNDVGYYGGGYAPVYGGDSGYGYSPYGNGGYTYYAPRAYVYPTYRYRECSPGIGTAGTYNGRLDRGYGYGGSRFYGQPYRPAYTPYGYGGYGGYGY